MKFQALNESSSSSSEDGNDLDLATKEAKEEESYRIYNTALKCESEGKLEESEELFRKVLVLDFIAEAEHSKNDESKNKDDKAPLCPALNLKYLAFKNLAIIANKKKEFNSAMDFYLKALDIDATDVSIWLQAGLTSMNIPNLSLARLCFEEGLKRSPNNWLCLDHAITVTYVLNDYANCLHHISRALNKEAGYIKGVVLKNKIFKENPGFQGLYGSYFSSEVLLCGYEENEVEEVMQEICLLKEKSKSISIDIASSETVLTLDSFGMEFTWKALGKCLISLYDTTTNSSQFKSLCSRIDMSSSTCELEKAENGHIEAEGDSNGLLITIETKPIQIVSQQIPSSQESSIEKDDNSPCTSGSSPFVGNFAEMIAENEKTSDPLIYTDASLGNKKPPKRKRSLLNELNDLCGKRRSTRVRNPALKRVQDTTNYQEIIHQFLPQRLIGDTNFDDPENYDSCRLAGDHTYGQVVIGIKAKDCRDTNAFVSIEKQEVENFISSNRDNSGLIDLLYMYVSKLGSTSNISWPTELSEIFSAVFLRLRRHITIPNLFCHETRGKYIKEIGFAVLTFSEFKVDHYYLSTGHSTSVSLSFSPKLSSTNPLFQIGPESIGKNFHSDMEFLLQLTARKDIFENDYLEFVLRSLWLKAKFHSVEGEVDLAISCIQRLTAVLEKECEPDMEITVANSFFSNLISLKTVQLQLESLQRCQSLEEIQRLFDNGAYQAVVDLLIVTFDNKHSKPKISNDGGIPERHAQLILLQDSLWKLENYQDCVKWSEVAFKESVQQYINATAATKGDWIDTMAHLLLGIERCFKRDEHLISSLEDSKLVRFTQNLILVICLQVDTYDISTESSLTYIPWIILHRLIRNEELNKKRNTAYQENKSTVVTNSTVRSFATSIEESEIETCMPSSLMLLITAHDSLGKRSCCTTSDGLFLHHCVDTFMKTIRGNSIRIQSYREELENALEQAFYCLYGHPQKRAKAKHLLEHNANQVTLTWERAVPIYVYSKPHVLPEFDSYRISTVSAELEFLLKRIVLLVPPEFEPTVRVDAYTAYIEGAANKCPIFHIEVSDQNAIFRDLYYLLGDYYFKNKEFSKAIRYYLLDVCINPERKDSWAGMALSRSSQLDQKLNSYEVRNEGAIWRKSSAALRCFEHTLQLNSTNNSLWIEYGSLAYVLHSHASRQLKLNSYSDSPRDLLEEKKVEMLCLAERCFREANKIIDDDIPEEAWLHHYMLGKIAQKFGHSPAIFLDHYQKSLLYLHEDEARYPHKIQYHNPPELSIEVLEVYYRIHASCLKYLCNHEESGLTSEELKVLEDCLTSVAAGPFFFFQEKVKADGRSSTPVDCDLESSTNESEHLISSTDHNYFNIKQINLEKSPPREILNVNESFCIIENVIEVIDYILDYVCSSNLYVTIDEAKIDGKYIPIIDHTETVVCLDANSSASDANEKSVSEDIEISSNDFQRCQNPLQCCSPNITAVEKPQLSDEITKGNSTENLNITTIEQNTSEKKICDILLSTSDDDLQPNDIVDTLNEIIAKVLDSASCKDNDYADNTLSLNLNVSSENTPKISMDVGDNTLSQNLSISAADKNSEISMDVGDVPLKEMTSEEVCVNPEYVENSQEKAEKLKELNNPSEGKDFPEETAKSATEVIQIHTADSKKVTEQELEESKAKIQGLIVDCLNGLRECLKRFIQHYKSLYRIAHYNCYSSKNKNLQWAREVLLAATPAVQNYPSMPGLFAERKNTNFFNGIWRAPSNEIDRPGNFGAHMYRSVCLLIDVLFKQNDYNMLLYVTQQLYRNPDLGKKYMRDAERISLTRKSYDCCVTILREQMNSLLQEEPPPEESRLTCCLLEIYRTFQSLLKGGIYVDDSNELLEEAYIMYKLGEVDQYPSVLDQAIIFCQHQLGKSYQVNYDAGRFNISKHSSIIVDAVENNARNSFAMTNYFTPDAWQKEFAKSLLLPKTKDTRSDAKMSHESLILIPVEKDINLIQHKTIATASAHSSQVVHVEKPRAENFRACSVAFLPVTSTFSSNKKLPTSLTEGTTLLSCQAYDCYDILETLMHASGYQILADTPISEELKSYSTVENVSNGVNSLKNISKLKSTYNDPQRPCSRWEKVLPEQQSNVLMEVIEQEKTTKSDPL